MSRGDEGIATGWSGNLERLSLHLTAVLRKKKRNGKSRAKSELGYLAADANVTDLRAM